MVLSTADRKMKLLAMKVIVRKLKRLWQKKSRSYRRQSRKRDSSLSSVEQLMSSSLKLTSLIREILLI